VADAQALWLGCEAYTPKNYSRDKRNNLAVKVCVLTDPSFYTPLSYLIFLSLSLFSNRLVISTWCRRLHLLLMSILEAISLEAKSSIPMVQLDIVRGLLLFYEGHVLVLPSDVRGGEKWLCVSSKLSLHGLTVPRSVMILTPCKRDMRVSSRRLSTWRRHFLVLWKRRVS